MRKLILYALTVIGLWLAITLGTAASMYAIVRILEGCTG